MNWLGKHSGTLQALSSVITAAVAVVALIGVKHQIDASYRVQQGQSAREIYREMLNISIANPEYASPDYCALKQSPKFPAYESYVEYVLYTAEQVIEMDPGWAATIEGHLETHRQYMCSIEDWSTYTTDVEALVTSFHAKHCKDVQPKC